MIRKTLLVVLVATIQTGSALMQAYSVEPVKAAWSGWTDTIPGYDYISQIITCNWDSLVYCDLFVGDFSDTGAYKVDVFEVGGGGDPVARNLGVPPTQPHSWLKMPLTTEAGYQFTKGRQYEFRFTRSGADSIGSKLDCWLQGVTMGVGGVV